MLYTHNRKLFNCVDLYLKVYLVDYGLSKSYLTVKKNKTRHIPQKKKHGVVGTVKFASIFLHEGSESS